MYCGTMPSSEKFAETIKEKISKADLYGQLAEEASELAQAACKMERILRGTNPTPKTEQQGVEDLIEEYTDLRLVVDLLDDIRVDELTFNYKLYRWASRLKEMEKSET